TPHSIDIPSHLSSVGPPKGVNQPHSFLVSSQIVRPPILCTSSIMWRVPPGPSPPSPFQRQRKSSLSAPKREAASSIQRLLRSYGSSLAGGGPSSIGWTWSAARAFAAKKRSCQLCPAKSTDFSRQVDSSKGI